MKKTLLLIAFTFSCFAFSQNYYSKISSSKVNQERLKLSENFISEFLSRCVKNDFTNFNQFKISKRVERFLETEVQKTCETFTETYGNIKVLGFNSAYLNKSTKDYDPIDLYIFDAAADKNPETKYINVWVYHDQNIINGIWISKEKPLGRPKY